MKDSPTVQQSTNYSHPLIISGEYYLQDNDEDIALLRVSAARGTGFGRITELSVQDKLICLLRARSQRLLSGQISKMGRKGSS